MLSIDTAIKMGIRQNQRERLNSCINDLMFMSKSFLFISEIDVKTHDSEYLKMFHANTSEMLETIGLDIDDISSSMNQIIEKEEAKQC
ncbi:hypothetical protein E3V36_07725 [Candidatus Marinimicrobia bacterium MT.SAG.2]|nr:hypothetical protein E3V36_07725 [Candidatus Marinimicrobia bacterium MT.SAG.2]